MNDVLSILLVIAIWCMSMINCYSIWNTLFLFSPKTFFWFFLFFLILNFFNKINYFYDTLRYRYIMIYLWYVTIWCIGPVDQYTIWCLLQHCYNLTFTNLKFVILENKHTSYIKNHENLNFIAKRNVLFQPQMCKKLRKLGDDTWYLSNSSNFKFKWTTSRFVSKV